MDIRDTATGVLTAAVVGIATWAGRRFKSLRCKQEAQKAENEANKTGTKALLRSEIIRIYNECHQKQCAAIYERDNVTGLHKAYKALGGNGIIDDLVEKIYDLPTEPPRIGF